MSPMNRGATIVFAPIWLVPGRIPSQPGAGSHGFATGMLLGRRSDLVNPQLRLEEGQQVSGHGRSGGPNGC